MQYFGELRAAIEKWQEEARRIENNLGAILTHMDQREWNDVRLYAMASRDRLTLLQTEIRRVDQLIADAEIDAPNAQLDLRFR